MSFALSSTRKWQTHRMKLDSSIDLPQTSVDGRARAAALQRYYAMEVEPTSSVAYSAGNALLIVTRQAEHLSIADRLVAKLQCTVLITGNEGEILEQGSPTTQSRSDVTVIRRELVELTGYLGEFTANVSTPQGILDLARYLNPEKRGFDMVLDLTIPPMILHETPPPGYYAPRDDPEALEKALEELPEMVGEFEKPKFYHYDPAICVHGRSGLSACTRCLEACPTMAIVSLGERVSVDSQLCQGAGSCATVCPSGAIRYAYPSLGDALERLRVALRTYRSLGGSRAMLLLHDAEQGRVLVARLAAQLPQHCIPVEVEEVGSTGMDIWLPALAYGAAEVVLLAMPSMPRSVMSAVQEQLGFARNMLEGMGYEADALRLHRHTNEESTLSALSGPGARLVLHEAAEYAGMNDKRAMIRFAVDHLHKQAPVARPLTILPAGAPFGEVWLAAERCTLCMACVSQCPTGALVAGAEIPELKFIEQNCVQCGLCARSCPENAIGPAPRYLHDAQQRRALRLLKAEDAFCCIRCGKPFATKGVIERMMSKLRHHRMFQGEAIERIQMCEDCRVKDMFQQE